MANIQVEIGDQWYSCTKAELFALAKAGSIGPETSLLVNGKNAKARKVKGMEFHIDVWPDVVPLGSSAIHANTQPSAENVRTHVQPAEKSYKKNKVIIVENTVRGTGTFFALLFPYQDNFFAYKFEEQFSQTLAEQNRQGWNVVQVTYGLAPYPKLSSFQRWLLALCIVLLTIFTIGIYLILYIVLAYFKRGRRCQYIVTLERPSAG